MHSKNPRTKVTKILRQLIAKDDNKNGDISPDKRHCLRHQLHRPEQSGLRDGSVLGPAGGAHGRVLLHPDGPRLLHHFPRRGALHLL